VRHAIVAHDQRLYEKQFGFDSFVLPFVFTNDAQIRIKMAMMGFSAEDFLSKVRKQTQPAACYANPNNPEEIYRGKGKRPKWLQEKLGAGASLEEFKV
jgi:H-NS histone family protein